MKYLHRLNPSAEFIAFDVETTGHSTRLDVIAEIAAIRYRDGVEVDRFVTLVKPAMPMLPLISRLTGITNGMLDHAPSSAGVARRLVSFLRGGHPARRSPLVIHNAGFDIPLLERFVTRHLSLGRSGADWSWAAPPVLCTLRLSRRLLPHLHSRRLTALAEYFDFMPRVWHPRVRFHRAGTDAEATAHVFFRLASMLAREGGF